MLVSYAKVKPFFINVELSMLQHSEFHMKEEGCKATSECSDKQRSQGNGLGSPGEPLGAYDYSAVILNRGPHGPPGGNLQVLGGNTEHLGNWGGMDPFGGESTNSH